ncbi:unnamed protein product [Linum trigynum]|uniref:Uncharacterized protein n=1 Tax=Linum trigynum TaxID=586398 RepID=A0AAV2CC78_9ROSI
MNTCKRGPAGCGRLGPSPKLKSVLRNNWERRIEPTLGEKEEKWGWKLPIRREEVCRKFPFSYLVQRK